MYFCGGTPYYVGASWFGYDNNQKLVGTQTGYARSLWNKAMRALHSGVEGKAFDKKGETRELEFCTASGELATDKCPKTDVGVYKKSNTPGACKMHGGNLKTTATTADPSATTTATTGTTTVPAASSTDSTTTTTPPTAATTAATTTEE